MLTLIAALPRATTYDNLCKEGARYLESATYGASAASSTYTAETARA